MPDPILIGKALATTALVAAVALLLYRLLWRGAGSGRASPAWALSLGPALFAGCWLLDLRPHWPATEALDRFLIFVLPALVIIEVVASLRRFPAWLAWLLRMCCAAAAGRILLHNTVYLSDLAGPGSSEWTRAQSLQILACLAAGAIVVWVALVLLTWHAPNRSIPLALALSSGAAGVTVMLSGYASGGQLGLVLSAALVGATLASFILHGSADVTSSIGVAVMTLFALLLVGRFFGELTTTNALLLFFAVLLCWLPVVLPYIRRMGPILRGTLQVLLVAVPVAIAVLLARQKFLEDFSAGSDEPSAEDYRGSEQ